MLEVSILRNPSAPGRARMSTHEREATGDYSKGTRPRSPLTDGSSLLQTVAAGLGLAGAAMAVVATFSTVIKIQVLTVTPATYSGYDRHSVALVVLGVFALIMIAGGVRGARPAMAALALVGLAVLLIAILIDLPHLNDTGVWPQNDQYEDAQASAGTGYYFETASGILMAVQLSAGFAENNSSPSAFAAARVISAWRCALFTKSSGPFSSITSSAALSPITSEIAGV